MPSASMPSSGLGWVVAFAAALAGLFAGLFTIRILGGLLGA